MIEMSKTSRRRDTLFCGQNDDNKWRSCEGYRCVSLSHACDEKIVFKRVKRFKSFSCSQDAYLNNAMSVVIHTANESACSIFRYCRRGQHVSSAANRLTQRTFTTNSHDHLSER